VFEPTPNNPGSYTRDVATAGVGVYYPTLISIVPYYNIQGLHPAVNVLHWEGSVTGYTVGELVAAQAAFNGAWSAAWKVCAPVGDQYLGCIVTDVGSNTGLQVNNSGFTPVNATGSGSPMPDNSAYLLSLKGSLHYKGGHGRVYIPGVQSTFVDSTGNNVGVSQIPQILTIWTNTVTAMAGVSTINGGPYNPVIWHKKLKSAPNTIDLVVSAVAQSRLATQRRRLRKVAHH
jgi:hypothetical protein